MNLFYVFAFFILRLFKFECKLSAGALSNFFSFSRAGITETKYLCFCKSIKFQHNYRFDLNGKREKNKIYFKVGISFFYFLFNNYANPRHFL